MLIKEDFYFALLFVSVEMMHLLYGQTSSLQFLIFLQSCQAMYLMNGSEGNAVRELLQQMISPNT